MSFNPQQIPQQFIAAQQAALETLTGLTGKAFEGVEKLVELNLQVVKTTLAEQADAATQVLSVKSLPELLSIQAELAKPAAEKSMAYYRHVYEIVSQTQAEVSAVAKVQIAEGSQLVRELAGKFAETTPGASNPVVDMMKSAFGAASNAYASLEQAGKQAVQVAENAMQTATTAATQAATQAAERAAGKKVVEA